jgi:hypothetical protein
MSKSLITAIVLALCFPLPIAAEEAEPPAAPESGPCEAAEYRQFDFWIGEWTVTSGDEAAGTNSVQPVHGGCALQENWRGSGEGGITGSSYNTYDSATGKWHQTWVDSNGGLLLLDGGMVDGSMVLAGRRPTRDGSGEASHRITWTPNPDGTVRQLWEASKDGGVNWSVLFDGLYTRQATPN